MSSSQTENQSQGVDTSWLSPTWFIESDHPAVRSFATTTVGNETTAMGAATALFYAVRDGWRYDPYGLDTAADSFRASVVLESPSAWCTPKAILFTAAARSIGIPARLGFADVRNHLSSEKLTATMGTDLFVWHGYSELLIDGRWFKLSTAFNIELCERFGVKALEFDGTSDALMHPFDQQGNQHMEYVNQRGSFDDVPLDAMLSDFHEIYPEMVSDRQSTSAAAVNDEAFAEQ